MLSGNVLDATGAIIPGATVKLTSQGQGTVRTAQTNEAGLYQFSFLPAGVYDVEVAVADLEAGAQSRTQQPPRVGAKGGGNP